ncbi:MAG: carboxylesterase family protein [Pseudoxanthomonas sp.]
MSRNTQLHNNVISSPHWVNRETSRLSRKQGSEKRKSGKVPAVATLAMGVILAMNSVTAADQASPVVKIDSGRVQGTIQGNADAYLGIPFAAAPVGKLRWRAPEAIAKWSGVRPTQAFGASCPQPAGMISAENQNEDCLFINVWAPKDAAGKKLPVMVSIHGGAYFLGSGDLPDTSAFTRDGVILVSFNYRLGRLGWFAHPALTRENPNGPLGSYGMMDQVAALQWVNRNIAAFGGDPSQVTIFGCSAGGTFTNMMMTSPHARGLFSGAIAQSDPFAHPFPSLATAETRGNAYVESLGLAHATVEQLRAIPVEKIVFSLQESAQANSVPIVDGSYLVSRQPDAFAAGKAAKVPYINSTNSFEGSLAAMFGGRADGLVAASGAARESLLGLYPEQVRANAKLYDGLVMGDVEFVGPQRLAAREVARHGSPTWAMSFDYLPVVMRAAGQPGSVHCADSAYVFERPGDATNGQAPTDADWVTARMMHGYYVNFAKYRNPNGEGLPDWPQFTVDDQTMLVVSDDKTQAQPNYNDAKLDILEAAALEIMRHEKD